jgi:hypothetical protein
MLLQVCEQSLHSRFPGGKKTRRLEAPNQLDANQTSQILGRVVKTIVSNLSRWREGDRSQPLIPAERFQSTLANRCLNRVVMDLSKINHNHDS